MRTLFALALCLLCATTAEGAQVTLTGGDEVQASANDTFTVQGTSVTYTGHILNIQSDANVYIDGQGDTIIFNSGDNDGTNNTEYAYYGIKIQWSPNVTCSGLVIIQSGENAQYNAGILFWAEQSQNARLIDCKVHVRGANSRGVTSFGSVSRLTVSGGNYTSYCDSRSV